MFIYSMLLMERKNVPTFKDKSHERKYYIIKMPDKKNIVEELS